MSRARLTVCNVAAKKIDSFEHFSLKFFNEVVEGMIEGKEDCDGGNRLSS